MDPSQYISRDNGLPLHELIQLIEDDESEYKLVANIYAEPPDDGNITDCDEDQSNGEHEADLNCLEPKMLCTRCEIRRKHDEEIFENVPSSSNEPRTSERIDDEDEAEDSSSDNEPLSKYVRLQPKAVISQTKSKKEYVQKIKWNNDNPKFEMNVTCTQKPSSQDAQSATGPVEFFKLFFSNDLLEIILQQTNTYAMQKNLELNMIIDELYVFIGGLLLSGYAKYPNKRMFWSGLSDVPKILADSMRLNRFEQILRNIHLNNNDSIDTNDKLYKLRPLINHLNQKFNLHGGLHENISIDESMIPYYSKHYAKQYIKGKPIRFGFKNWALCSSEGYMITFEIYISKGEHKDKIFRVGGDIVCSLINDAGIPPREGYKIF